MRADDKKEPCCPMSEPRAPITCSEARYNKHNPCTWQISLLGPRAEPDGLERGGQGSSGFTPQGACQPEGTKHSAKWLSTVCMCVCIVCVCMCGWVNEAMRKNCEQGFTSYCEAT